MVGITYDAVETNRKFVEKHDIAFAMLTDAGGEYFRELGIFNDELDPDHRFYGIPHPGIMLVDADGRVVARFAEEDYRERPALEDVLDAARELAGEAR